MQKATNSNRKQHESGRGSGLKTEQDRTGNRRKGKQKKEIHKVRWEERKRTRQEGFLRCQTPTYTVS